MYMGHIDEVLVFKFGIVPSSAEGWFSSAQRSERCLKPVPRDEGSTPCIILLRDDNLDSLLRKIPLLEEGLCLEWSDHYQGKNYYRGTHACMHACTYARTHTHSISDIQVGIVFFLKENKYIYTWKKNLYKNNDNYNGEPQLKTNKTVHYSRQRT